MIRFGRPASLAKSLIPVALLVVAGAAIVVRARRARRIETRLPRGAAEIGEVAARIGMTIPPDCMPGVTANLKLLDRHLGIVRGGAAA